MNKKKKVNDRSRLDKNITPLAKILPRKNRKTYLYSKDIFEKRVAIPETTDGKPFFAQIQNNKLHSFYGKVMYDLLEAMIFDFIQGDIIIFDKKRDLKFFMSIDKASKAMLLGEQKGKTKIKSIPYLDFSKLDYGFPRIMMELGRKDKPAAFFNIPPHLYLLLIEKMYKGKRYIKSSRRNSTPAEYYENDVKHRKKWRKK